MNRVVLASALASGLVVGICLTVAVLHAFTSALWENHIGSPNGEAWLWGNYDGEIYIDPDPDISQTGESAVDTSLMGSHAILYVGRKWGGTVTGHPNDPRAEIFVNRPDLQSNAASAWMKSSGGAEVLVADTGDVIITIGD